MNYEKFVYLLEHWAPPGFPGSTGGTLYNYKLVELLANFCQVEVLTLNAPERVAPPNVRLETFSEHRVKFLPWRFATWRNNLLDQARRYGTETVIMTTSATNAVLRDIQDLGYKTISVVQAYEDFGLRAPGGDIKSRFKGLKRLVATGQGLQPALTYADKIIVNSQYMANALEGLLGRKIEATILYPPLTLQIVQSAVFSQESLRRVGFVNRAGKNFDFIVQLASATPEYEFLIYGHDIGVSKNLPPNVNIRGWEKDKQRMYKSAYTWLMPSKWQEPFGLVAIEALSQGCRVAVSSRGGLSEAVGGLGALFHTFNIPDWRDWLRSSDCKIDDQRRNEHLNQFKIGTIQTQLFDFLKNYQLQISGTAT